jgi:hypothetical protein
MTFSGGPPMDPQRASRGAQVQARADRLRERADHERQVREAKASPSERQRRSLAARLWSMITGRAPTVSPD